MPEQCTWITFHAHPTQFVKEDDNHPDFFGVFACPVLRGEPEQLLGELLSNRNLLLVQITHSEVKSNAADWGRNERLKTQVEEQGYALSLTKMHQRPASLS